MTESRQYDTVAFDVRDNATMLFFAKTTDLGDISDYLLLMRTIDEDFDDFARTGRDFADDDFAR